MSKTANITEFLNSRKVELSSEAVELSSLSDYNNLVSSLIDLYGRATNKVKETVSVYKSAMNDVDSGIQLAKKGISLASAIEANAKDLGVDLPGKYKSLKDRHILEMDRLEKMKQTLEKTIADISKA